MSDPDKVLMQIIDTMLPILTGAMRSTVTGLLDEAYAQGVADERARVVADLMEWCSLFGVAEAQAEVLRAAAERYRHGEHVEEKP